MIKITQKQFDKFRELSRNRFILDMDGHVAEFFPNIYEREGSEKIQTRISKAIGQAATFGLVGRSDVCKFVNITFMFGEDFFNRQSLKWMADILDSNSNDRMSNFYEIVIRQLQSHNR